MSVILRKLFDDTATDYTRQISLTVKYMTAVVCLKLIQSCLDSRFCQWWNGPRIWNRWPVSGIVFKLKSTLTWEVEHGHVPKLKYTSKSSSPKMSNSHVISRGKFRLPFLSHFLSEEKLEGCSENKSFVPFVGSYFSLKTFFQHLEHFHSQNLVGQYFWHKN